MLRIHDIDNSTQSLSEAAIKQFESAWQQGIRPSISDYLKSTSSNRLLLLIELVHIDLEFRFRHNESPQIERYLQDFPELLENNDHVIEFIRTEYYLRHRHGSTVTERDYLVRFPQYRHQLEGQLSPQDSTFTWPRRLTILPPRDRPQIPGFDIGEELGHGGMGVVYRASQPALNRVVAIKTLMHGVAATTSLKERFRHEAEAIARLDHPHIVPIYEVGEWTPEGATTSIPFFVMKYYSGGSLANTKTGPGTALEEHARLVETIAQAVHHAHQRGILHRDLKPSNILLDEQAEPHVVDFGLAGRFDPDDPQSMTATVMGTPSYMAPEQARSPSQVTTAADVYGLGAIFYQLLTGQPPFRGETPLAVLEQVTNRNPVRPSLLNGTISRDLETICLKCMEKVPAHRYESAAAVAADLHRYRTGQSIIARPSPTWERVWRIIRRHPIISFMMLLTFGVLVSALAVLAHSNIRIREQEQDTRVALEREKWMRHELLGTLNREQQLLYGKRISTVSRLWASNQLPQAWKELDLCPDRFRSWEWRYYNGLRNKQPTMFQGSEHIFRSLEFLSETQFITGDALGRLTIWDVNQKSPLISWKGCEDRVRSLSVDIPQKLVALCDEKTINIWKYDTQEHVIRLEGNMWVTFSPDGSNLASSQGNEVVVWDTANWKIKCRLPGHNGMVLDGCFAPDSRTLVSASIDRTVRHWSVDQGKAKTEPWKYPLPAFRIRYLSDGKHLAISQPSSVFWVDAISGKELGRHNWSNTPRPLVLTSRVQVATGPHSSVIAFNGPGNEVILWDIRQNREVSVLRGNTLLITAIQMSPSGQWLATVGLDRTLRVWNTQQKPELQSFGDSFRPHTMAISPDGESLAVIPNHHASNSRQNVIQVLNTRNGSEIARFSGAGIACFHPDSRKLITTRDEGGLACWDLETKTRLWQHEVPLQRYAFIGVSSDNNAIVAIQINGHVKLIDTNTGKVIDQLTLFEETVLLGSLSRKNDRVVFAGQQQVEIWDLKTRKKLSHFPMNGTPNLALTHDGEILATAEIDRVIRIRSARTSDVLLAFPGHPRPVNALAFNRDGKRLVTACADGFVRIWDVETGLELAVLPGQFEENVRVTWDHARDQIIAVDTRVHIWQAPPATTVQQQ